MSSESPYSLASLRAELDAGSAFWDLLMEKDVQEALIDALEAARDELFARSAAERTPTQLPHLYAENRNAWQRASARREAAFARLDFRKPTQCLTPEACAATGCHGGCDEAITRRTRPAPPGTADTGKPDVGGPIPW